MVQCEKWTTFIDYIYIDQFSIPTLLQFSKKGSPFGNERGIFPLVVHMIFTLEEWLCRSTKCG